MSNEQLYTIVKDHQSQREASQQRQRVRTKFFVGLLVVVALISYYIHYRHEKLVKAKVSVEESTQNKAQQIVQLELP